MATNSESQFPLLRELTNHQNSIYAYIFSLVPKREIAQEILQETNLVICEKADQFLAQETSCHANGKRKTRGGEADENVETVIAQLWPTMHGPNLLGDDEGYEQ